MPALESMNTLNRAVTVATTSVLNNVTVKNGSDDTRSIQDGGRYGRSISCGYCDVSCVYSAIETVFLVGVFANVLVIYTVIRDKYLHDPTFVAIAALALADMLFLLINVMTSFESVILTLTCTSPVLISRPFHILKSIFWFAANSHVALLAVLRYVMTAFPLRSNAYLGVKRVIVFSAGVWILGSVLVGVLTGLIFSGLIFPGRSEEFVIILWTTVYLIPLVVTSILHIIKLFLVKKSTHETATESTQKSIKRMSKIVITVIIMAAILPLPRIINKLLKISGSDAYPSADFKTHFVAIAEFLFLVNNFINPFIYGFLSQKFRESVRRMFNCKVSDSDDSEDTTNTSLSVRRENFNLEAYKRKIPVLTAWRSLDKTSL